MSPWRAHWVTAQGACSLRVGPRNPVSYGNRHLAMKAEGFHLVVLATWTGPFSQHSWEANDSNHCLLSLLRIHQGQKRPLRQCRAHSWYKQNVGCQSQGEAT